VTRVGDKTAAAALLVMHFVGKYAWLLFVIIPLLLLVIGLSGPQGPVGPGTPIAAFGVAHPSEIDLELRFRGTVVLGMVVFSLATTLFSFRKGARWAWFTLWAWPVFFLLHLAAFDTWVPDLPLAILAAVVLGLSAPRYLRPVEHPETPPRQHF
jgi:hypothetical protein